MLAENCTVILAIIGFLSLIISYIYNMSLSYAAVFGYCVSRCSSRPMCLALTWWLKWLRGLPSTLYVHCYFVIQWL